VCLTDRVTELLFSYGTLRQPEVQLTTFGRELDGRPDAIVGYDLEYVTITDPHVIATSGSDRHPILKPTERADAAVEGTVFAISAEELAAADEYEVDDYRRIAVPLRSGDHACGSTYSPGERGCEGRGRARAGNHSRSSDPSASESV
jgi:gamma-glutamylcyclotransferase (GGCT)/AIG2-like uncharacterized protein YtfP